MIRSAATFSLSIIAIFVFCCSQLHAHESNEHANSLLNEKKYREAEQAFEANLADDKTGEAHAGFAASLALQDTADKITRAEAILREARKKFPPSAQLYAAGACAAFHHAHYVKSFKTRDLYCEAAEALCKRARDEDPDNQIAREIQALVIQRTEVYSQAEIAAKMKQYDLADQAYKQLLDESPDDDKALEGLSTLYARKALDGKILKEDSDELNRRLQLYKSKLKELDKEKQAQNDKSQKSSQ